MSQMRCCSLQSPLTLRYTHVARCTAELTPAFRDLYEIYLNCHA